ncbi:hypothetical protein CDAR_182741 [Caerostris darwini]|uniref:Uncharacterized protein n=1 Tax=Caerostris darwini TaxID=1538125 RepID=A0AAV4SRS5_9ARAC|nr:hypothetical protein CDAR_182741 [Caerostris darwini]
MTHRSMVAKGKRWLCQLQTTGGAGTKKIDTDIQNAAPGLLARGLLFLEKPEKPLGRKSFTFDTRHEQRLCSLGKVSGSIMTINRQLRGHGDHLAKISYH